MPADRQSDLPHRAFVTGMFDMRNFGDLMFPLIARQRLARIGIDVVAVSPTGKTTGLSGAADSISLEEMLAGGDPICGMLIGGGYVIHTHKMLFLAEYQSGDLPEYGGPGIWLGATLGAAIRQVPVAWNAPGVPHPFPGNQRALIDAALAAADYVSVRDAGSAELLAARPDLSVKVVPDPVASIADLWPRESLRDPFERLIARKGGGAAGYVAFHFRNRSLADVGVAAAAERIDAFARSHTLCPILIAVGQTHADDILAREISSQLKATHIVLDDPSSLEEIAAAIAFSKLYIGASLHGYVAAAAYGVPGVLVALPSYRKFQGFLDHTGRREDLAHNWQEAFEIAASRAEEGLAVRIPQTVLDALDTHWQRIGDAFAHPQRNRMNRQTFLQSWFRAGLATGGPIWAHLPFVRRSAGSRAGGET
ncbi:MAG: polysaccharide pyruvyl transferase family protein [Rhizomicrobium sp.]|jgi:hypothetical protein